MNPENLTIMDTAIVNTHTTAMPQVDSARIINNKTINIMAELRAKIVERIKVGRFTIVEVGATSLDGLEYSAIGIARRSALDRNDDEVGFNKAIARAAKALKKKMNHQKINSVLMG